MRDAEPAAIALAHIAHLGGEARWGPGGGRGPQLLRELRGAVTLARRLVAARLALASVAMATRPAEPWASCVVGAAAFAGSFAGALPALPTLAARPAPVLGRTNPWAPQDPHLTARSAR